MTISVVLILSLISAIAAAPTQLQSKLPGKVSRLNHPILGDIHPGDAVDDKIINRRYLPLESCKAIQESGFNTTGLYVIQPKHKGGEFTVFCDMTLLGGGWTIIQRRVDDSLNFNRKFRSYQNGFGNYFDNFWLGLEKIHQLAIEEDDAELYIGLENFNGDSRNAIFSNFFLDDEEAGYTLRLTQYNAENSTAGDSLVSHSGMRFSTKDKDRDSLSNTNCAEALKGGWWYKNCHESNLNGVYYKDGKLPTHLPDGILWQDWLGDRTPLKTVVIATRPKN